MEASQATSLRASQSLNKPVIAHPLASASKNVLVESQGIHLIFILLPLPVFF